MSRSNPQLSLALPIAPKPIHRVYLATKPPEGMRWIAEGEKFEAMDMHIGTPPHVPIHPGIIGQIVRKGDVGKFARWDVLPAEVGLMARILKKK